MEEAHAWHSGHTNNSLHETQIYFINLETIPYGSGHYKRRAGGILSYFYTTKNQTKVKTQIQNIIS